MDSIKKFSNVTAVIAVAFSFILYVFSYDPFGIAECAYIFLAPAILACRFFFSKGKKGRKNWYITTFIFSYIAWVVILIWLRHVYPPTGYLGVVLLPLFLSTVYIYPWYVLLPRFLTNINDKFAIRLLKISSIASIWVILEWVKSWLFTGFPWGLIANTQWNRPASIQLAEYGGTWIVSFGIIFFNVAIAEYIFRLYQSYKFRIENKFQRKAPFSRLTPEIYIALLMILSSVWVYLYKLPRKENEIYAFTAGMVQTDFAGILKWDDNLASQNLQIIKTLTEGLSVADVDVVLWPEAATPPRYPVIGSPELKKWVENLSKDTNTPILMGNMAYNFQEQYAQGATFAVSPTKGLYEKYYAKQRLVPFGEYVPFWCSFIKGVVPIGNMKAGESSVLLDIDIKDKNYKVGSMICYEDIFSYIARDMVNAGANILFVCTNDSWYGREGGAYQHASHSALQAVSTRLPLLRASNNGLSTVFDQYGRMRPTFELKNEDGSTWDASTPEPAPELKITDEYGNRIDADTLKKRRPTPLINDKGSIYFRGAGYADVVYYKNFQNYKTFYVKYGDWFVYLCFGILIVAIVPRKIKSKK